MDSAVARVEDGIRYRDLNKNGRLDPVVRRLLRE